jgi:hypothetical protein
MPGSDEPESASERIDARIRELRDWRGETLARIRRLIRQADPDVTEEWKWRGVPVWSHDGMLCTGESYKNKVKVTFAKGAALEDPVGLFNASLEGNTRRAIDLHEGDELDEQAFTALVRSAADLNASSAKREQTARPDKRSSATKGGEPSGTQQPKLLSGGNPQIPKGDGDAPVQAYLDAMPGWKRDAGHRLDALIVRTVPNVAKAVRWNSPFYGVEGRGWFLSFHCFTKYIKVAFFRGASLDPLPPVDSKDENTRYFHIHEDEDIDEELVAGWIEQASALPGWVP